MAWRSKRCGFSVIEFMIAVALLCIVAAVGVPNFIEMQYRAKRAEVPANLEGIRVAAIAYRAAHGQLLGEDIPRPDAFPGKRERPWRGGSRFDALGWEPEGTVRGSYTLVVAQSDTFVVKGFCDVDGNGEQAVFQGSGESRVIPLTEPEVF
jgi:prepilin-type N-terminal cleavage/methylation domain-containing protein